MFAKPNEIGSAESLTTEIENVAGSLRLNVALPFEARRYEFSLPAGEETLDGSNEDEVPVLRRVIDTHAGEVIRTTSLPTVIKEVLIARYGGVRTSSQWFSARATLKPEFEGSTDREVRNAIEEFEAGNASNEPVIMTDGGIEVTEEKYGYLSAACPQCGFEIWRSSNPEDMEEPEEHGEDGVRDAVERHLDVCSEFEPIKVRADSYVFNRIAEYQGEFQGTRSFLVGDAMRRQKTNMVIISPAEAEAVINEFTCYDSDQRTWMNGMQDKALRRVRSEILEAMEERGFEVGGHGWFGSIKGFHRPEEDAGDDEEPEVMTDGGSDEERHEREEQRQFDRMFASSFAPDDARYVMVCHHCGTGIWRKQDSTVVKRARRNEQPCECGGEFRLIEDAREEDYSEMECPNGCGLLRSEDDLLECPSCSYQTSPDDPRADGGEGVMTDGGEEPTESNEESEEPPRWRDWSNVKNERNSERLMTDGGSRVHPDDEGVEILDSENDDDSDIIDAGDDGEIIADGGRPVREEEEFRTLMGEYNPEEWNPEPDPDYYRSGEVSIHDPIEGEAYSEPGHWADRPADMDADHARRLALRGAFDDLDEHQPLPLISSNMRGVPTEGVQGSYSEVVELDEPCSECSQCWGIHSTETMAGVHMVKCLVCEHVIEQG